MSSKVNSRNIRPENVLENVLTEKLLSKEKMLEGFSLLDTKLPKQIELIVGGGWRPHIGPWFSVSHHVC